MTTGVSPGLLRQAFTLLATVPPATMELPMLGHGEEAEIVEMPARYRDRWRQLELFVHGHDLQQVGLRQGSIYRELLNESHFAQLAGTLRDRDEAIAWILGTIVRRG